MFEFLKLLFTKYTEGLFLDHGTIVFENLFSNGFSFKRILAAIIFLLELPGMLYLDMPITPTGPEIDLSGYEMVFYDEFEGDSLDLGSWFYRGDGKQRGGFSSSSQVSVRDGNLVITGEYLEDGRYGEGWYGGSIALNKKYKNGYFEIKCISNKGGDLWSAFWIQADNPYTPEISKGGVGGAEIDIFEAMDYDSPIAKNTVRQTIHCSGMQGDTSGGLNSCSLGKYRGKNIYEEYNTYGCEWTEDEYIFYVNGVETVRTSWADGVSQVAEQVLVSLCVPDVIEEQDKSFKSEFIVDYVKIYQKNS